MARRIVPWIVPPAVVVCALIWGLPWPVSASTGHGAEDNSCVDCHLTLEPRLAAPAREWLTSIHADFDVSCTTCHGGDALDPTQEGAKSEESGYVGRPAKDQIPELCGGCHADSERMAPYGLPTNQLSEYYELSKHGQLLAQGDQAVATCYDCHGGHAILDAQSPSSTVYPVNLPQTCGKCHSDASLMEPYGVDTHQYELFRESVHGIALLEEHNLRAPTCATCHGNHGAALPGLGELVDTCGLQCHPSTKDAYLSGAHGAGASGTSGLPTCVDCHGRYDVQRADEALLVGDEAGHCGNCHSPESPEAQTASLLHQELSSAASAVAEAGSPASDPERVQILLQAQTRLLEARVLQHSLHAELVQPKTKEAIELSAQAIRDRTTPGGTTVAEWTLALLIGGSLGVIVIILVVVWFVWRGMRP